MPFVLRKIRKAKWHKLAGASGPGEDEIQADALWDLKTEDNQLSVWNVEDDQSNLDLVLTAVAANCQFIANVDYVLIDQRILTGLNIQFIQTNGNSPYQAANKWHCDLLDLSAGRLLELAKEIYKNSDSKMRKGDKEVKQLLVSAVTSHHIDTTSLHHELQRQIEKALPSPPQT